MINSENILQHELIGLNVEIESSTLKNENGINILKGTIVDETKNTLIISSNNAEKIVPKKNSKIKIFLPIADCNQNKIEVVEVDGAQMLHRPEDRIKKLDPRFNKHRNLHKKQL